MYMYVCMYICVFEYVCNIACVRALHGDGSYVCFVVLPDQNKIDTLTINCNPD